MSSIGAANIGALNLAGSAAGAARGETDTDRVKQNAADQKTAGDRDLQSARALGDVSETDLSSERDADGRQPYGRMTRPAVDEAGEEPSHEPQRGLPDPSGERGNALDLQA